MVCPSIELPGCFSAGLGPICFPWLKEKRRMQDEASSKVPQVMCGFLKRDGLARHWTLYAKETGYMGRGAVCSCAGTGFYFLCVCKITGEAVEIRRKMPHCTPTAVWAQGRGKGLPECQLFPIHSRTLSRLQQGCQTAW